jgi:4'-phosphopantetheinyl transferase
MRPEHLCFSYNDYGKPALVTTGNWENLNFNLSHSDGLALYGITRGREIGIDLERVHEGIEFEQVAKRFFSQREREELQSLPAEQRPEAFFNCWTRKEAYIKARGGGLAIRLDQFDVSLAPDKPALLLGTRNATAEAYRWTMRGLNSKPGYVGALVVEGTDWQLAHWQWHRPELSRSYEVRSANGV